MINNKLNSGYKPMMWR